MSGQFMLAAGSISLAFVLYTIGVFWERAAGRLRLPQLVAFWLGLVCDATGTTLMGGLAQTSGAGLGLHAITGALALVLMLFHAGWATYAYVSRNEARLADFHKLSTAVWLVWTLPYAMGVLMGVPAVQMPDGLIAVHAAAITVGLFFLTVVTPTALRARR